MSTLHEDLGVTPAINAAGKLTVLGGSRLDEAVIAAMGEAARSHVVMDDLLVAAGRELARATGTEDACPTTGAAAGIAIAVAALVAGTDPARVERLPDAGDAPAEVVLQKGHAVHFGAPLTQMIALGGGRPVEVGSVNTVRPEHLSAAVTERTAALLYVRSHHAVRSGEVPLETVVALGRAHGVPVIVDAAAEEDLRYWPATGADLVVYSGGKAIGGPTSGLICGRAELIAACRAQYGGIGRPMKVSKEAVFGLVRAVRAYEEAGGADAAGRAAGQQARMARLAARLDGLPGVSARVVADPAGRGIHRAELTVDPEAAGRDAAGLAAAAPPPIFLRGHDMAAGRLAVDPRPLTADEEEQVVARLTGILTWAAPGTRPDAADEAVERRLVVTEPAGLHARPAAVFAQTAGRSAAVVTVRRARPGPGPGDDAREVSARSVLSLMSIGIRCGEEIVLSARGPEAERTLAELAEIVAPRPR
ncbi:HPr family phosphocarrier protein [Streptomyces sp. CT34]|uniref:HPr family phosphocarrier protein n=1 Tax=Streptomyces sp. CT34 TaxID=1553907 RepID=UPI0007C74D01|nr:HPr family phosphocarrier protein [Streptomyces sp. CT34]